MSKKDERLQRVEDMLLQGTLPDDAITAHVSNEFGVKEDTVLKDIETLRAQDEPLPFGDEPGDDDLLMQLLRNEVDAHNADLSQIDYTPEKEEEGFVHVLLEVPTYNDTGDGPPKKDSRPRIQKLDPKAWVNFAQYHKAQGYKVHTVLHLPKGAKPLAEIDHFGQ